MKPLWVALGAVSVFSAGLLLVGLFVGDPDEEQLRKVGMPAAEVCGPVVDVPPTGASQHVSPPVTYDRTPPNSGPHMGSWVMVRQRRYPVEEAPAVEQVVHNLEHGWVVIWYHPQGTDTGRLDHALAAAKARKLVAFPWVGSTPLPTPYVITAWGHEQRCTGISGVAIADFLKEHGGKNGDAPEPTAP